MCAYWWMVQLQVIKFIPEMLRSVLRHTSDIFTKKSPIITAKGESHGIHSDILDNWVLWMLWQQFKENPYAVWAGHKLLISLRMYFMISKLVKGPILKNIKKYNWFLGINCLSTIPKFGLMQNNPNSTLLPWTTPHWKPYFHSQWE